MFGTTQNQGGFNAGIATPNNLIATGANGIFGANNDQQRAAFGGGQQAGFGQGQQTGGFGFGANQQQGGGAFGGNQQQGGAFGAGNNNTFGGGNNSFGGGNNSAFGKPQTPTTNAWGAQNNNTSSAFGQNQGAFGGGTQSTFGQQNQGTAFGNSAFGATNQNTGFGAFGATNTTGNAFGTSNQNTSGFGNNQNANGFGNNQNTGAFGNTTANNSPFGNQNANTSAFGAGNNNSAFGGGNKSAFGGGFNNNTGGFGGGFGNNNANQNPFGGSNNNSAFGANKSTPGAFGAGGNSAFGGTTSNNTFGGGTTGTTGAFGANNNNNSFAFGNKNGGTGFGNTGVSIFGNIQNNNTGGFGATTGSFNNANQGFGANNQNTTPSFGGGTTPGFGSNNGNLGGTSWGVPTGNTANQGQTAKFVPLKSKNPKIDQKHLVKSIVLLDQNVNFCKNQLRIQYLMNGTSSINKAGVGANTTGFMFGYSGNTGGFGAQQNTPSFGQPTTPLGGAGTSAFGASNNTSGFSFGQNNNTTSAFGQSAGSAFGQTTPQQGFGNSNNTTTGTGFGGQSTGMFGGQTGAGFGNQQSTGMFGGGGSAFGTAANNGNSAFSFSASKPNTTPAGSSTFSFGQTNTNGGFSFGSNSGNAGQPSTGMFGNLGGGGAGGLFSNLATTNTTPAAGGATSAFGSTGMFGGGQTGGFSFGQTNSGSMFGGTTPNAPNSNPSSAFASSIGGALYGAMTMQPQGSAGLPAQMLSLSNYSLDQPSNPFSQLLKNSEKNLGGKSRLQEFSKSFEDKYKFANTLCEPGLYAAPSTKRFNRDREDIFANLNDIDVFSLADELERKSLKRSNTQRNPVILPYQAQRDSTLKNKPNLNFSKKNKVEEFKEDYEKAKNQFQMQIVAKDEDLPNIGKFSIRPSLENLCTMTPNELKKVKKVTIENEFGKVVFLNPISLFGKKLEDCISIEKDSIELKDEQWNKSRVLMTFRNFGGYQEKKEKIVEKNKLEKKIKKWVSMQNMKQIQFDEDTGDLTVELIP